MKTPQTERLDHLRFYPLRHTLTKYYQLIDIRNKIKILSIPNTQKEKKQPNIWHVDWHLPSCTLLKSSSESEKILRESNHASSWEISATKRKIKHYSSILSYYINKKSILQFSPKMILTKRDSAPDITCPPNIRMRDNIRHFRNVFGKSTTPFPPWPLSSRMCWHACTHFYYYLDPAKDKEKHIKFSNRNRTHVLKHISNIQIRFFSRKVVRK